MIQSDTQGNEAVTKGGKRFCLLKTEAEAGCTQRVCKCSSRCRCAKPVKGSIAEGGSA